jgi:glutamine amidotransferase
MENMEDVAILDYDLGNLNSVERAVRYVGGHPFITKDIDRILDAPRMILPGVGAFWDGMNNLNMKGLTDTVIQYADSGKPILGICLGMQLLMSEGHEFGLHKGLDLIKGKVVEFPKAHNNEYKIPHVGWSVVEAPGHDDESAWKKTILVGQKEGDLVYFVHSFIVVPEDKKVILARTEYGGHVFCSVIRSKNICGCQFHPEKSGEVGLNILKNFMQLE